MHAYMHVWMYVCMCVCIYVYRIVGFLELLLSANVCMRACVCLRLCVCLPPRLLITSGVIWTPYDWSNKFYGFYMAAVVDISSGHDVSNFTRREN